LICSFSHFTICLNSYHWTNLQEMNPADEAKFVANKGYGVRVRTELIWFFNLYHSSHWRLCLRMQILFLCHRAM
jgi:hypothetical protein